MEPLWFAVHNLIGLLPVLNICMCTEAQLTRKPRPKPQERNYRSPVHGKRPLFCCFCCCYCFRFAFEAILASFLLYFVLFVLTVFALCACCLRPLAGRCCFPCRMHTHAHYQVQSVFKRRVHCSNRYVRATTTVVVVVVTTLNKQMMKQI